jgi:hypothetical protein
MYLLLIGLLVLAQSVPMTDLVFTGGESAEFTHSDTNACFVDDTSNALHAQLLDPTTELILSFTVLGTVGDHPAKDQMTALTLDGPADDPFVNWSGASGTVTLDDVAASVPIEAGDALIQASTHGVVGHIDADLKSKQGSMHVSGPFACHSPL